MDDHIPAGPVELWPDQALELADAAFTEEDQAALEEAHRDLYALYADRVWRNPSDPRHARLERVRVSLEAGLRDYLDRRRRELDVHLDAPPSDEPRVLARWLEIQALAPHPADVSGWRNYVREDATIDSIKHIIGQRSHNRLREPDPWIYVVPTLRGNSKARLIDLLHSEYGHGELEQVYVRVYAQLMQSLDLDPDREQVDTEISWQYLAMINHQWMCALDGSLCRRLLGTIYLAEAASCQVMRNFLAAWDRLGVEHPDVLEFYALHAEQADQHGRLTLGEVVLPVCSREGVPTATAIATGMFDARTLEADFAASEIEYAKLAVL